MNIYFTDYWNQSAKHDETIEEIRHNLDMMNHSVTLNIWQMLAMSVTDIINSINASNEAFDALGLPDDASENEVKERFKKCNIYLRI